MGYKIDDRLFSTNFDRLGFQRMIDNIETGKITCVITKHLSSESKPYFDRPICWTFQAGRNQKEVRQQDEESGQMICIF